jgi:hypothetical protein
MGMRTSVLIEGSLVLAVGLVGSIEGLRLVMNKDPHLLYDMLGPGYFVLVFSLALMAMGVIYIAVHCTNSPRREIVVISREMRLKMINIAIVCAFYVFLISIVGYPLATFAFFLLQFRVVGIKSLKSNILLSFIVSGAYYIIFVQCFGMFFPRGIFG